MAQEMSACATTSFELKVKEHQLTIETLVFALVINVVEVAENLDGSQVRSSVIYDALRSILDKVLEQLKRL